MRLSIVIELEGDAAALRELLQLIDNIVGARVTVKPSATELPKPISRLEEVPPAVNIPGPPRRRRRRR